MEHDNEQKKRIIESDQAEEITSNKDLDTDVVAPQEPATGASENAGPSEDELPEEVDDFVRENMFPSAPDNPEEE